MEKQKTLTIDYYLYEQELQDNFSSGFDSGVMISFRIISEYINSEKPLREFLARFYTHVSINDEDFRACLVNLLKGLGREEEIFWDKDGNVIPDRNHQSDCDCS